MPAPIALTPNMVIAREYADAALREPEGVYVTFLTSTCGSLKEAHRQAYGLSNAFHNLRSRWQRRAQRSWTNEEHSKGRDSNFWGDYGRLACVVMTLPNEAGYKVGILKAVSVFMQAEVTSASTGKRIDTDPERTIWFKMVQKAERNGGHLEALEWAEFYTDNSERCLNYIRHLMASKDAEQPPTSVPDFIREQLGIASVLPQDKDNPTRNHGKINGTVKNYLAEPGEMDKLAADVASGHSLPFGPKE